MKNRILEFMHENKLGPGTHFIILNSATNKPIDKNKYVFYKYRLRQGFTGGTPSTSKLIKLMDGSYKVGHIYYGTFGFGQPNARTYVKIYADNMYQAQTVMHKHFGSEFCTVYNDDEWYNTPTGESQADYWGYGLLKEISIY